MHYTEIQKKNNLKYKIDNRWLNILLNNNFNNDKERILSDNNIFAKKKSNYNFFNRQSISYFPIISKENFKKGIKKYYSNEINFDKLLENNNYFSNTKTLLLKEETGQIIFFD